MSSLQEIMRAISTLSPADRARLVKDLPTLLPELDGNAAWERIIQDPAPGSKLSALVDGVDAEYGKIRTHFLKSRKATLTATRDFPGNARILAAISRVAG